jgi:hypothetical protein
MSRRKRREGGTLSRMTSRKREKDECEKASSANG